MIEKSQTPINLELVATCLAVVATVDYHQEGHTISLSPNEENGIDLGYVSNIKSCISVINYNLRVADFITKTTLI